jgi:hypothetical protein
VSRETVAGLRAQLEAMTARATRAEKQVDDLTKALVRATAPQKPTAPKKPRDTPDVERTAFDRAERSVKRLAFEATVARAKKDLVSKGHSERAAEKEARRLVNELMEADMGGG